MNETDVHEQARMLFESHGAKAVAEVAQKATALEKSGKTAEAKDWRRIEAALRQMQGAHES